jgi:plastocyanin
MVSFGAVTTHLGGFMMRRTGLFVAAIAATAAAALPAAASAAQKQVFAGAPPSANAVLGQYGAEVNNFFRQTVTIHEGDTVEWETEGFHTIDIPPVGQGDLPLIVPGPTVTGVNDAAGNPFWFNGKVPSLNFNPALFGPSGGSTYNGTARVDSGLPLGPPAGFKVTFTKAGVYHYFCDVHAGMEGTVVVLEPNQKIPTAAQDALAVDRQVDEAVRTAKRLAGSKVTGNNVSVGEAGGDGVEVLAMFPSSLTVKTGTVVKFSMTPLSREVHTAAFGPDPYLDALGNTIAGPGPFAQQAVYASDQPVNLIPLTPTTHGNGFANTGFLDEDPTTPLPSSGQIKFNAPGVYRFRCLIHPFMQGTITVTN